MLLFSSPPTIVEAHRKLRFGWPKEARVQCRCKQSRRDKILQR